MTLRAEMRYSPAMIQSAFSRARRGLLHVGFAAVAITVAAPLRADDLSRQTPYRPTPWHLIDVQWIFQNPTQDFRELSIKVHFSADPGNDVRLYVAPTGAIRLNGILAYGGLQARGAAIPGRIGKQLIFSRWDERRREYIRPVPGGVWRSLDTEGDFISVRAKMEWGQGTYRVVVSKGAHDEGEFEGSWVEYKVCVADSDECTPVGALKFPGRVLRLGKSLTAFIEVFGPAIDPATIPKTRITFSDIRVNGERPKIRSITSYYDAKVPPYADGKLLDDAEAVAVDVGRPVNKRYLPTNSLGTYIERMVTRTEPVSPQR